MEICRSLPKEAKRTRPYKGGKMKDVYGYGTYGTEGDYSDYPRTREELFPVLEALEELLDTACQEIWELDSEAKRLCSQLEEIRDKLTNLRRFY